MKYIFNIIIISLLILSSYCTFQSTLFNRINKGRNGENLIISPLSIFQALSLAANGANGQTLSEMLELLQYDTLDALNQVNFEILSVIEEYTTIDIANAIMTKFTPLKTFRAISKKYLAPIKPLESVEQVNEWCSNKTHGKITKILDELEGLSAMIIINAVYFRGEWALKFEKDMTKKLPFYNLGSQKTEVDTMTQISYFSYYEDKNVQAVRLHFQMDDMSAIVILPQNGTDINKYINTLSKSKDEYNKIIKGLRFEKVHLQMPKFELNFEQNLRDILMDLGMFNAFSIEDADFTWLKKEKDIYIGKVIHKTYLKVFEEGCEAAAVTAVEFLYGSAGFQEIIYDMKIDRPFLFLLKNSQLSAGHDLVFMSKIEKIE